MVVIAIIHVCIHMRIVNEILSKNRCKGISKGLVGDGIKGDEDPIFHFRHCNLQYIPSFE